MVPWLSSSMRLRRSETGFGDDHPVAIGRISDRRVIFSLRFERQTVLTTAQGRDRQMPQPSSAGHQASRNFESRKQMLELPARGWPRPAYRTGRPRKLLKMPRARVQAQPRRKDLR